jgi:DNA-binding HxlR family transcriptional regulator
VIQKPDDDRRVGYALTARGKTLLPVIPAMRDWGLGQLDRVPAVTRQ